MTEAPFDVVGVGINSVDRVIVVPALPGAPGLPGKMHVLHDEAFCGGQTATALAACARLGLRTKYVGATGRDVNGRLVREALSNFDVDLSSLTVHDAVTRWAVILVDEASGERLVLWDYDERLALADAELPADALRRARLVHVDDVDVRASLAAAAIARSAGVIVTSDIDQVNERTADLIDAVSVAIFAEEVPLALAGGRSGHASLDDLRDALAAIPRRRDQVLCATVGDRGALALDADGFHYQPAFPVRAIDTTAAGDVFRAGLIFARLSGWPLDEQLRWGNAAAAVACTRLGAMSSVPTRTEIEKVLSATC